MSLKQVFLEGKVKFYSENAFPTLAEVNVSMVLLLLLGAISDVFLIVACTFASSSPLWIPSIHLMVNNS